AASHTLSATTPPSPPPSPFPYTTLFRSTPRAPGLFPAEYRRGRRGQRGRSVPSRTPCRRNIAYDHPACHPIPLRRSAARRRRRRSEEHTSELQSRGHLVCRLLLEKKNIC